MSDLADYTGQDEPAAALTALDAFWSYLEDDQPDEQRLLLIAGDLADCLSAAFPEA